ncbi:ATP-binding protein [Streptomyces salinarius]|uniref:ATP-binding protein n=1 Tax=Streptomyces salinarius TaxID=2762598 RepID=A0ABW8BJX2_9ACTN
MKNAEPEYESMPEPSGWTDDRPAFGPAPIPFNEPWEYELRFPRGPAVARTTLKAVLGAHGLGEFTDRAELLASELATNAVRYSVGPATVRLRWTNPCCGSASRTPARWSPCRSWRRGRTRSGGEGC